MRLRVGIQTLMVGWFKEALSIPNGNSNVEFLGGACQAHAHAHVGHVCLDCSPKQVYDESLHYCKGS